MASGREFQRAAARDRGKAIEAGHDLITQAAVAGRFRDHTPHPPYAYERLRPNVVFLGFVLALTTAFFAVAAARLNTTGGDWDALLLISVVSVVSVAFFSVRTVMGQTYHLVGATFVAAAVVLPPALAALSTVPCVLLCAFRHRRSALTTLFNVGAYTLATLAAASVFTLGGGDLSIHRAGLGVAVGAAVTFVLVSNFLFAVSYRLRCGFSLRSILTVDALLFDLGLAMVGLGLAWAWSGDVWVTPLFIPVLLIIHKSQRIPKLEEKARLLQRERQVTSRLLELDRLKGEFAAVISHELRNPIVSIGGYTQLLLEDDHLLTTQQRSYVEVVKRNSERLGRLVEDLALIDEVESGLAITFDEIDLRSIVGDSVAAAQPRAAQRQIELNFIAADDCRVRGDAGRLGQVADNLITNAIKYTQAGGAVEVRVLRAGERVALDVADNGPGIAAGDQERLFDRFFRTESAKLSQTPGTGLGLALVKGIVDQHGGTVTVNSAEGRGTTFGLTFDRLTSSLTGGEPLLTEGERPLTAPTLSAS